MAGTEDIEDKSPPGGPILEVKLRPDRLTQYGFRPVEVMEAVELAYAGTVVGQVYEGNRVFEVAAILDPALRQAPQAVSSFLVRNSGGLRLPLRELAAIYPATGRYIISHEGARRRQTVTCNTHGRDIASVMADIRRSVAAKVRLPEGAYIEYGGAAEQQAQARNELILYSTIAGVGIVLLLGIVFRDWRRLLLVLANVPFALVGGVLAAFLSGWLGGAGKGVFRWARWWDLSPFSASRRGIPS